MAYNVKRLLGTFLCSLLVAIILVQDSDAHRWFKYRPPHRTPPRVNVETKRPTRIDFPSPRRLPTSARVGETKALPRGSAVQDSLPGSGKGTFQPPAPPPVRAPTNPTQGLSAGAATSSQNAALGGLNRVDPRKLTKSQKSDLFSKKHAAQQNASTTIERTRRAQADQLHLRQKKLAEKQTTARRQAQTEHSRKKAENTKALQEKKALAKKRTRERRQTVEAQTRKKRKSSKLQQARQDQNTRQLAKKRNELRTQNQRKLEQDNQFKSKKVEDQLTAQRKQQSAKKLEADSHIARKKRQPSIASQEAPKRSSAPLKQDAVYHYTYSKWAKAIKREGLRPGSFATPSGTLSSLQARLELALPPNRIDPDTRVRIDTKGLREAGYTVPKLTRVASSVRGSDGRTYQMPGGGREMRFPYAIPGKFLIIEQIE